VQAVADWLRQLSQWVWGLPLIGLLISTGVYLTILLRGIQFHYLGHAFRQLVWRAPKEGQGDISPFEALTTSLAATIGTGNVAGVAAALAIGGLGALFWIWVSGLVGMAITFSEAILALRFRVTNRAGQMAGGPMYYIREGLGWRWMAVCYALFGVIASLGIGNLVQAHSIADVLSSTMHVPPIWTGVVLALLIGLVLIGGIRSIGKVSGYLVPAMALFYFLAGVVILIVRYASIPEALWLILRSAFTGQAALGGFVGSTAMMAMRMGIARGLFSNEAGLGSNSIAAAAAKTDQPGRQAMLSMVGTFVDTLVICSITGLSIAVSGVLGVTDEKGALLTGAPLTAYAFASVIPGGALLVAFSLILFASTTIIAWAYYGEKCLEYLAGTRSATAYRIFYVVVLLVGSLSSLHAVWSFADIANGLMALPNLIALLALSGIVASEAKVYLSTIRGGSLNKALPPQP
jgi:alanine or glycine:cation symporter, AGCS family